MTEPTTIQGENVRPNPKAFGFNWKVLQKLLEEQQKFSNEQQETDGQWAQLEGQISVLERREFDALADAIRAGSDEPGGSDVAKAKAELEQVKGRAAAQSRALQKIESEIFATVSKHAPEWRSQVHAKAKERAEAVEDAVHRLQKAQAELYQMSALGEWLEQPRRNFAHGDGPHLLDTFTHRDVRLGEVFDAVIQDAREKSATPDEREQQRWASMGAVTPSPGWIA